MLRDKTVRYVKLFALSIPLALMGFGCRFPGQQSGTTVPSQTDQSQNSAEQPVIPKPEDYVERPQPTAKSNTDPIPDNIPSQEVLDLRQVFQNLGSANTYRAEMHVPSPAGKVLMEIFYNHDSGIYGKIHAPKSQGGSVTEVFINGNTILYRDEAGVWSDITKTKEASNLVGAFSKAIVPTDSETQTIDTSAEITVDDSVTDCKLYHVKQYIGGGNYENFSVCTAADLPKHIEFQAGNDTIKVDYYDINGDIKVYKPKL